MLACLVHPLGVAVVCSCAAAEGPLNRQYSFLPVHALVFDSYMMHSLCTTAICSTLCIDHISEIRMDWW